MSIWKDGPVSCMLEDHFHSHLINILVIIFFSKRLLVFWVDFLLLGQESSFWKRRDLWKTPKNSFEGVKELGSAREVFYSAYFDIIISEIHSRSCIGQDDFSFLTKSSLRGNTICQICRHAVVGVEFLKGVLYILNFITCFIKISK